MRDLTIDEIELVSGGDIFDEIESELSQVTSTVVSAFRSAGTAIEGAVDNLFNGTNATANFNNTVLQAEQMCGASGVQSISSNGGTTSLTLQMNGGSSLGSATITRNNGTITITCKK